jgi:hypothetical protein
MSTAITQTTPYRAQWTSASEDLTSSTANAAPVIFPRGELDSGECLNLCVSADDTTGTPAFDLILGELQIPDSETNIPSVLRSIPLTFALSNQRNVNADNSGGHTIAADVIVDIRGLPSHADYRRWYLALTALGGVGVTTVRLLRYHISTSSS